MSSEDTEAAGAGKKRKWDMTSAHSLEGGVRYLRKQSDALIVLAIRAHDCAIDVDETLDVIDVHDRLWERDVPRLLESLRRQRDEKRAVQLKKEPKR